MTFNLTRVQRAGLSVAGMFYGQLVAAAFLAVAILARNAGHLAFLRHNVLFAVHVILGAVGLVGVASLLAWLVLAMPFLLAMPPETLRRLGAWPYLASVGVGAVACLALWLAPAVKLHSLHGLPHLAVATAVVACTYGWIVAAVGLWRYLAFAADAERLAAKPRD